MERRFFFETSQKRTYQEQVVIPNSTYQEQVVIPNSLGHPRHLPLENIELTMQRTSYLTEEQFWSKWVHQQSS